MYRRVTSPTWGPPPPCKQALKMKVRKRAPGRNCQLSSFKVFFSNEFHKCVNIVTVTMINCSKIQFSLFGSLRDDSKSEKTFNDVALAYNGRKPREKNKPIRILNNTVRFL